MRIKVQHSHEELLQRVWREETSLLAAIPAIALCYFVKNTAYIGGAGSFGALNDVFLVFSFGMVVWNAMAISRHAERLAKRLGDPYGTMILTLSAIAVEVVMVITMMTHGGADPQVGRDTIYSTLMILLNLVIGLSLFLGWLKFGEQRYNIRSSKSYLAMIFILVGLGLMFPNVMKQPQLHHRLLYSGFLIDQSLTLYLYFLKMQSGQLSYFFISAPQSVLLAESAEEAEEQAFARNEISIRYHGAFLLLTLVTVSILAEFFAATIDVTIEHFHAPKALAGLVTAVIILSPESLTAIRAAMNNQMQRVINIVLGSSLSTVALTIPAVLIYSAISGKTVTLALQPSQMVLLIISLLVFSISETSGETNPVEGLILLSVFAAFIVLIFV
jgi:Ca2+:H+ antiporter